MKIKRVVYKDPIKKGKYNVAALGELSDTGLGASEVEKFQVVCQPDGTTEYIEIHFICGSMRMVFDICLIDWEQEEK